VGVGHPHDTKVPGAGVFCYDGPVSTATRRTTASLVAAWLAVAAAPRARAQEPPPQAPAAEAAAQAPKPAPAAPPAHKYQGAYWGLQLHLGLVHRLAARADDLPGPMVGVSARIASILSIADFQLNLQGSMYTAHTAAADEVAVKRLTVELEGHFHPMFMQHLQNTDYWFWVAGVAGIYGSAGVALEITDLDGAGQSRTELDAGWHLGAGMDYPLTDVHAGWSLWLGVAYKLRFLSVDTGIGGLGNFSEHTVVITLGYRNNDIFFGRLPKPSEFDYRDPAPALPE
jgi:hypothetical protein